jgi:hypothetical protein
VAIDDFAQAQAEASQAVTSIDTLPQEEREFILTRVSTDLESFAQENPAQSEDVKQLIDLINP